MERQCESEHGIMWTESTLLQRFVQPRVSELKEALEDNEWDWSDALIEQEDFRDWFNESFAADRWIDFVSSVVDNMSTQEQIEFLATYGLDEAIDVCRTIGVTMEDLNTRELVWHVMDHWYSYYGVIHTFQPFLETV